MKRERFSDHHSTASFRGDVAPDTLMAKQAIATGLIRRTMPLQKPGKSFQDYATPWPLIRAVETRWGKITYDLAAEQENTRAKHFFCPEEDSLKQNWALLRGTLWLNPPFGNIAPWAAKCAETAQCKYFKGRVLFLVPASVGSNWFVEHIFDVHPVLFLQGRIPFDGKNGFPKDCMLVVFTRTPPRERFNVWDIRKVVRLAR